MYELALALNVMLTHPPAQAAATEQLTAELKRLEQTLATSWKTGDCAAWGALIAEDWSVIHLNGSIVSKAAAMASCRAPEVKIEAFTIDDVAVRAFGDTAVVTGRTVLTVAGVHPTTVRLRFTDVVVRQAGRWKVVASQATAIVP